MRFPLLIPLYIAAAACIAAALHPPGAPGAKHHGPRSNGPLKHFRGLKQLSERPKPVDAEGRVFVHQVQVPASAQGQGATSLAYNVSVKPGLWVVDEDPEVLAIECDPVSMDMIFSVMDGEGARNKALQSTFVIGSHQWGCPEAFSHRSKRGAPFYR